MLPAEPGDCRRRATEAAERSDVTRSAMWSLLGILGELVEIRRELKRGR